MSHRVQARLILALAASVVAGPGWAQTVLNVYGPGGPAPAVKEAAAAFGTKHGLTVNVVAGPTAQWVEKARRDADVIFSGAENMFTDFAAALPGAFEIREAYPLYLRPAVIVVRPGNPKNIRGFRDLLAPNVRILTVAGAGQIGLWEDVAGRTGDIAMVRAFRRNMVFPEAANTGAAKEQWTQQREIDAWLVWNIWQVANPDLGQIVELEEPFRIYRGAGVTLTHRGKADANAGAFVEFLKSADGRRIFAKWGWDGHPAAAGGRSQVTAAQRFARLDTNHDGSLTWQEAAPSRARDFDAMDVNNDRRVTQAEFTGQQRFENFDIDKDGSISKAEFLAGHRSMFLRLDADADQRISPDEFATARDADPGDAQGRSHPAAPAGAARR